MFTNSCRICLQPAMDSKKLDARHSRLSKVTILEMFRFCFPSSRVTLSDARYPQHVCRSCLRRLASAYNLKKMCKRTNKRLLKHAKENPLKDTTNDSFTVNGSLTKTEKDCFANIKNDYLTPENDSIAHIKSKSLAHTEIDSHINMKVKRLANTENDSLTNTENNSFKNMKNQSLANSKDKCIIIDAIDRKSVTEDVMRNVDDDSDVVSLGSLIGERGVERRRKGSGKKNEGGIKEHVCSTCGLRTAERALWLQHLKLHPYTHFLCSYCAKGFKNAFALNVHLRCHTRDKPFACEACDRRFTQKHSLLVHVRALHRRERPFRCTLCDASFARKEALVIHSRAHAGVKAYACGVCGARFRQPANLSTHAVVHTGVKKYSCAACGFRTAYSSALKKHERGHRDEREHACADCDKRFRDRCTLTRHRRTHTGELPYECPHCESAFIDSWKRSQHVRRAHPDETQTHAHG